MGLGFNEILLVQAQRSAAPLSTGPLIFAAIHVGPTRVFDWGVRLWLVSNRKVHVPVRPTNRPGPGYRRGSQGHANSSIPTNMGWSIKGAFHAIVLDTRHRRQRASREMTSGSLIHLTETIMENERVPYGEVTDADQMLRLPHAHAKVFT